MQNGGLSFVLQALSLDFYFEYRFDDCNSPSLKKLIHLYGQLCTH